MPRKKALPPIPTTTSPSTTGVTQVPLTDAVGLVTLREVMVDELEIINLCQGKIVRLILDRDDEPAKLMEARVRKAARAVKVVSPAKAAVSVERTHQETIAPTSNRTVVLELLEDGAYAKDVPLREYVVVVMDLENIT